MTPNSVRGLLPEIVSVDMTSRRKSSQLRRSFEPGINEALEDAPYVTKEEAEEVVEELTGSYSMEELRERLPEEMFDEVVDHLDLGEGPQEKAVLAKELYDDGSVEEGGVGAAHHLSGTSPWEETEEVEISKSTEALDRFYESLEEK